MAGETVKVTGGQEVEAYFSKLQSGVQTWVDPVYVGFTRKGSHGRLIERGFHPRGGSTFVPGRHILEQAKQRVLHEAKGAVLNSIKQGGPAALAAKHQLGNQAAQQVRASTPRRSGRLAGSVTVIVGGSSTSRRKR